ncbi:hypothetical protein AA313_de0203077 [Arthrobotrys entomopaga]|nr:hypothetical protein AA313_de0203077 [Arthrobotrys entomopaga]
MATPAKKWAVLIGINDYNHGNGNLQPTKKYNVSGEEVGFRNLSGCLPDVENVQRFLVDTLQVPSENIEKLLAPCPDHPKNKGLSKCTECSMKRPTYRNIVDTLRNIAKSVSEDGNSELPKRNKGDLVYVHYSGHGARTTTVYSEWKGSSGSRTSTAYHTRPDKEDDTLVPCDILYGGRFIRDVEISILLNAMIEQELVVTITLDSCHSGGADRGENDLKDSSTDDEMLVRGIEEVIVSTPSDEPTSEDIQHLQEWSKNQYWLYEPKGHVLLAACQKLQKAKERSNGGIFTKSLFEILRSAPLGISSQAVYDRVSHKVHKDRKNRVGNAIGRGGLPNQTPLLLGNMDRFFFNERLQARVYGFTVVGEGTDEYPIRLNGGSIHGVRQGSVYDILPHESDPSDSKSNHIAQVRVVKVLSGYSLAMLITPKEKNQEKKPMEGCSAVLRSLPLQEQFSAWFKTENESLRGQFTKLWHEKYSSNAWLVLKNEDIATTFEISTEGANLTIKSKLGDITSVMGEALPPLSLTGRDLSLSIARLVRILEHLAQYEMFKNVAYPQKATEESDIIIAEVIPAPEPLEEELHNEAKLIYPVTKMEVDKNTGLYQAEENRLFRLKVRNKLDRKVHFAVFVCSAEFSINKIYPPDAPYKTLTRLGNSNNEAEDYFDIKAAIADELREASERGWSPVETYKIFASVCANDLVRLNSLTLEPLSQLDLNPGQLERTSPLSMQSEPQNLEEYFQAWDIMDDDEEFRNSKLIRACIREKREWQISDVHVRVTTSDV